MDPDWRNRHQSLDAALTHLLGELAQSFGPGLITANLETLRENSAESCADVIEKGSEDVWMVKAVGASCGESVTPVRGLEQV